MNEVAENYDEDGNPAAVTLKDSLGVKLRALFDEAEKDRTQYEEEWLKDLRQFKGIYEPEIEAAIHPNRSHAFVRLTRTKVRSLDARITDMLFPANGEKNWSIQPTPVPEIPEEYKLALAQTVLQATGEEATEDQLEIMVEELAEQACSRMESRIDDQLTEGKYSERLRDVIHSGHLFGTGILKGPMTDRRIEKRWSKQENVFMLQERETLAPYFEHVPIWDIYPDMAATDKDDCEFIFQRHTYNKSQLRKLAGKRSFDSEAIRRYLREHPKGDTQMKTHETELRTINAKLDGVEGSRSRKYEVLEYWGFVDGETLAECGCEVEEDEYDVEFEANVWMVGNVVIKIVMNPTDQSSRPYHFYYFEKDETSIFGVSVPSILRDPQTLYNSAIRATLDNAAISAGPQIEVNLDLLDESEDPQAIFPFRVWLRTGAGQEAAAPAIRVFDVPSRVKELMGLADVFKQLADETSTIPSYMHGEQDKGVGKTVGGLSMLMGAANITMKDVARNFDNGITKPFIEDCYHWNMQFSDDEDIKGDYQVRPKGSTSLVAKEIRMQQLTAFSQATANPVDAKWMKRGELLRQLERAHDLDDIVKDDEEYQKDMMEEQAMMAQLQAQGAGAPGIPAQ